MNSATDDLNDPALRDRAVLAAQGRASFDVLLCGGRLADMATGEIRDADVGLVGPLIASVHPRHTRRDAHQVIELDGAFVVPGLIDTHVHIESSMVMPRAYASTVVPQGTTTICWDPHEVGNVKGMSGVHWAIEAGRDLPLRILTLAPSCVPSAPGLERSGACFGTPEMEEMLGWSEIAGVAEIMDMRGVLDRTPHMRALVDAGLKSGKLVCGHARDLMGPALQGFAAAGIQSDHEITGGDDLLDKLRAGMTIELRVSHDVVLPKAVAALNSLPLFPQTVTLCTDDIFPDELQRQGGIVEMLRRLVRYGLEPMHALRAATLNAAMRLHRRDLGLVAAGRRADIAVFSDLQTFDVREVFASGKLVAKDGRLIDEPRCDTLSAPTDTMHLEPVSPADFVIHTQGDQESVVIRTVDRPRFTRWAELSAQVSNNAVMLPPGTIMMAALYRHGGLPEIPKPVLGVLSGWGEWHGALASTIAHDSHNLMVFGRNPEDMAAAANALITSGGGMAVARDGVVIAQIDLPVCGLLSLAGVDETARDFASVRAAADSIVVWDNPMTVVKAVIGASLACNPGPHVTDMGITDGSTGKIYDTCLQVA